MPASPLALPVARCAALALLFAAAGCVNLTDPQPWPSAEGASTPGPSRLDAVDVQIVFDPGQPIRAIDERIYSFNVAPWVPDDYRRPNGTYLAMLEKLRPALLRFPAGHWSQSTHFDPTNTLTSPPAGFSHLLRADELDAFVEAARAVGAEPLLGVNLKTGSPEMASALVRYANVERGYGVRWFELGNEPDLEGGRDTSPAAEAEKFLRFASAMRAVDPSIRLVGGVFMTGAHVVPREGSTAWMREFASRVGAEADALSWHWYPLDSDNPRPASGAWPSVEHLLAETARDWPPSGLDFAERACAVMEDWRAKTGAEHWVTELGPDSGAKQAPGITDGQAAAVWVADALPRLAECGADAVFQFALRQHAASNLTLLKADGTPTPMWGAYQLLSEHWRGTAVVARVPEGSLSAHGATRPDGASVVVLANKGPDPIVAAVQFAGPMPLSGERFTLEADGPTATRARLNGETLDADAVLSGVPGVPVDPWGPIEVPAYGVVVLVASR